MRHTHHLLAALFAGFALLLPAQAQQGGTELNTYTLGGSFFYSPSTVNGSDLNLRLHGGMYYRSGLLFGIDGFVHDNDCVTTYQLAGLCQYHFLDNWLVDANGRPSAFSPYIGALLGITHGENPIDDDFGLTLGARLGCDVFFTQNIALAFGFDVYASTGDVYDDDTELKGTDFLFSLGFDFFF